jgi:hypothetical protein
MTLSVTRKMLRFPTGSTSRWSLLMTFGSVGIPSSWLVACRALRVVRLTEAAKVAMLMTVRRERPETINVIDLSRTL